MAFKGIYKVLDFDHAAVDLAEIFSDQPHLFFLDSGLKKRQDGRYSFVGFDPFDWVDAQPANLLEHLRKKFFSYFKSSQHWSLPLTPLPGGVVGYFAYDLCFDWEKIKRKPGREKQRTDAFWGFYDVVLTVDHLAKKLIITSCGWPETNERLRRLKAQQRLNWVLQKVQDRLLLRGLKSVGPTAVSLRSARSVDFLRMNLLIKLKSNFTSQQYIQAIQKVLKYIQQGDIYQLNLSQRFSIPMKLNSLQSWEIYRRLRERSLSNASAFFNAGLIQIISSSPERFVSLKGKEITTFPMKGTRARAKDLKTDQALLNQLRVSSKEKAELLMVTDLERNDLGRVCRYGSVRVKNLRKIDRYSTVYQATAQIAGLLRDDCDAFEVIKNIFPSGSVTGCPKRRAIEIIESLEPDPRSVYTGALGYINASGDMDLNVLIRTVVSCEKEVSFHVGGGIVADSSPDQEYEETLLKGQAMIMALTEFIQKNY